MQFTKETLWKLRKEIPLCSLYLNDYYNSFGFDHDKIYLFFEGYAEWLEYLMNEDGKDGGNKFFDYLDEYDTPENLWDYYYDKDHEFYFTIMRDLDEYDSTLYTSDYCDDYDGYESCGGYCIGDVINEIADNHVSINNCDIYRFLQDQTEWVEQAIDELGWDGCGGSLTKAAQMGEFFKITSELDERLADDLKHYAVKKIMGEGFNELDEDVVDELDSFIDDLNSNDRFDRIDDWIEENITSVYKICGDEIVRIDNNY